MHTKFIIAVLLLSVAHQGCANSQPSTTSSSFDVLNAIETSVDVISHLGFGNGVTRGVKHCKELVHTIREDFGRVVENIRTFGTDARAAYETLMICNSLETSGAVMDCYLKTGKIHVGLTIVRCQSIVGAFQDAFKTSLGLPFCMFKKDPQ